MCHATIVRDDSRLAGGFSFIFCGWVLEYNGVSWITFRKGDIWPHCRTFLIVLNNLVICPLVESANDRFWYHLVINRVNAGPECILKSHLCRNFHWKRM